MQDNIKSGVYCIENKITKHKYIGQSVDIKDRWRRHISELHNHKHHNEYLQNSWDKYGEDSFDFTVLEYCEECMLDQKEIDYIKYYNTTDRECGYNLTYGGQYSCHHTDEIKQKISESNKKAYLNPNRKKIQSINASKQWNNPEIKAKIIGENNGMYGKHHSEETRKKISEMKKGKPSPHRLMIPVFCIELNKEFSCAAEAAKELNIQSGGILYVCRGIRKTAGGYHWKFIKENN